DHPGDRRGDAHGQRPGDPDRRVPVQPARHRDGHQPGGRHLRHVHRPDPRRRACCDRLAAGVPRVGPDRRWRRHLVVPQPARGGDPDACPDRLAPPHHLPGRPDPPPSSPHPPPPPPPPATPPPPPP